ncbi:MAG: FAD-dependent oxidoreductase [Myxococcales bacterium]|nr:FAD-dependent oxidoreductase [Myxococcales bacterium]MDH3483013.1 FAD-dependent oxidoreductase [Myxococcales bacterium]
MSTWWPILIVGVVVLVWLVGRRGRLRKALARLVERKLEGYRHEANRVDPALPRIATSQVARVAVLGGGLAGIGAAATLGERGIDVTLFERNAYLGGKIGAWRVAVGDGEQTIEHGFHAFFRQYYNLNRFLDRLGVLDGFREIEDYLILDFDRRPLSFGDVEKVPALNILDLGRRGFYRWRDVTAKRTRNRLDAFLRFDMTRTYETLDDTTFERFCDDAALPAELRVSFRTFARAFFSNEADLSTADVLRAFHFYYLSHDHGLMYDYPVGDYETTLLAPIRAHLHQNGVEVRLSSPVESIERGERKRFRVAGGDYDWVVIGADIAGAQAIVEGSAWLKELHPNFVASIQALRTSHGYAVWRIWVDRDVRPDLPTFINVDRQRVLDSVTLYHRITDEARQWAEAHDGAVLELHSYALPSDIVGEGEVRRLFLKELEYYFPELGDLTISAEALQIRNDFPAFAPGQHAHRPEPKLPIEGLLMAGDWVRLPYPMTHMEAAFTSGLLCANEVLDGLALQQEPIFTVAPKGLLQPRRARSR